MLPDWPTMVAPLAMRKVEHNPGMRVFDTKAVPSEREPLGT